MFIATKETCENACFPAVLRVPLSWCTLSIGTCSDPIPLIATPLQQLNAIHSFELSVTLSASRFLLQVQSVPQTQIPCRNSSISPFPHPPFHNSLPSLSLLLHHSTPSSHSRGPYTRFFPRLPITLASRRARRFSIVHSLSLSPTCSQRSHAKLHLGAKLRYSYHPTNARPSWRLKGNLSFVVLICKGISSVFSP